MPSSPVTRVARVAVAVSLATAGLILSPVAASGSNGITLEVKGLNGPRGVAVGPGGRVVVAEADGTVSRLDGAGSKTRTTPIASVPPTGLAPAVSTVRGTTYILTTGGGGPGAGTLYTWNASSRSATPLADIVAYQATDPDPYDLEGFPEDSNPYGVVGLAGGGALVADAAGQRPATGLPHRRHQHGRPHQAPHRRDPAVGPGSPARNPDPLRGGPHVGDRRR